MRPRAFTASLPPPRRMGGEVREGEGRGLGGEHQGLGSNHTTHLFWEGDRPQLGKGGSCGDPGW